MSEHEMETATAIMARASESYHKEARFHAIAQSAVARAMQDHGPVDPERADEGAHDIALKATALLLQQIYEDDAELAGLRVDRDRYKASAFRFAELAPPTPMIIPKAAP